MAVPRASISKRLNNSKNAWVTTCTSFGTGCAPAAIFQDTRDERNPLDMTSVWAARRHAARGEHGGTRSFYCQHRPDQAMTLIHYPEADPRMSATSENHRFLVRPLSGAADGCRGISFPECPL